MESRGSILGPGITSVEVKNTDSKPYIVDESGIILTIVAILFLLLFYFWLTYATAESLLIEDANRSDVTTLCSPGQCPTDQTTGEKICPPGSETYAYNILTQVCSNPTVCNDSTYRYAINSDGSTNNLGICQVDPSSPENTRSECRCTNRASCPRYITTAFTSFEGNPYVALNGTRTSFSQSSRSDYGGTSVVNNGSIQVGDPNVTFCEVPMTWVLRSSPGCNSIIDDGRPVDVAIECLNTNPCLQGTLAYITDDSSSFDSFSFNSLPVGCVAASRIDGIDAPCCNPNDIGRCAFATVYDSSYGGINCVRVDIGT